MLAALNLALVNSDRVSIVLSTGRVYSLVSVVGVNAMYITLLIKRQAKAVSLSDIDVIFLYKNTTTATTVATWAINPATPPADPVLGLAVTNTFNLTVVFDSGYKLPCVVQGEANPDESDLAYIANVIGNETLLAVFVNNNVNKYLYDVATYGVGTPGETPTLAAPTYHVDADAANGSDSNSGSTSNSPFLTLGKALDTLRSAIGNNQDVIIELEPNTVSTPYIVPVTTEGFYDYAKITIRARDNVADTTYIDFQASTATFRDFNSLTLQSLRVISGTALVLERLRRADILGCRFDTAVRIVPRERCTAFVQGNDFNANYLFAPVLDIIDTSTLCFEGSNNLNGSVGGVFASTTKGSRCEVNKVINVSGSLALISENSFARFSSGSTGGNANIVDASSHIQIGTVIT